MSAKINLGNLLFNPGDEKPFVYKGPSMNPTLKAPDVLEVIPYENRPIEVGDVIVFFSKPKNYYITHRVCTVTDKGILTKGDNNDQIDPWLLSPAEITGQVVSAIRGSRQLEIYNGRKGQILLFYFRTLRFIRKTVSKRLNPFYNALARSGIFYPFANLFGKPHLFKFERYGQPELKLVLGRMVVGQFMRDKNKWRIRPPFKILIDQLKLPDPTAKT